MDALAYSGGAIKMTNSIKAIEITNLTKLYPNGRGINEINLEINQGDIFGFLGPNGAGKNNGHEGYDRFD